MCFSKKKNGMGFVCVCGNLQGARFRSFRNEVDLVGSGVFSRFCPHQLTYLTRLTEYVCFWPGSPLSREVTRPSGPALAS